MDIAPQTGKLMATMCGSNLVKVEKALNLYNLRERPHSHNFYYSLLLYVHGCSVVYDSFCDPMDYSLHGSSVHDFPGKNTGVGCHFLLQGIFPTQGWNWHLLHWQMDSLPLSQLGRPILLWSFYFSISSVVNLLLCLIYELNFTTDIYVWEKTVCVGLNKVHGFRHPLGVLEHIFHG